MVQRRIRLNLSGGTAKAGSTALRGSGAGAMKGLRIRKVKKSRVKGVATEAEAVAPELEETAARVHSKQTVHEPASTEVIPPVQERPAQPANPRPITDTGGTGVKKVTMGQLKKL